MSASSQFGPTHTRAADQSWRLVLDSLALPPGLDLLANFFRPLRGANFFGISANSACKLTHF